MAKRSAPSSTFDNHHSLHNPRITRSAARLAADSSTTAPSAQATPTPPQAVGGSRKRKGVQRDSSPDSPQDSKSTAPARRSKRQKVTEPDPPPPPPPQATSATRSRRSKGKSAAMSTSGPSEQPLAEQEPSSQPTTSSSKRKSSRNKKQPSDASPSTPQPPKRQSKKAGRKSENVALKDAEENEKSSTQAMPHNYPEEEEAGGARDPTHDEEEDDEEMDAALTRSGFLGGHASLSSAMRAMSGMMGPSGTGARLRDLLESLRQKDDPSTQLIALGELSQLLLVSTEDNLSGHLPTDQFVKELVALMQPNEFGEENSEMMLLACRCIANMMEALPQSASHVVYGGAVPILCQKLLEIQYIDLAEQALSTLEKISLEFPAPIVREGGLTACLTFLDFFATGTQRTAVTTAANCCRNIPADVFPTVRDVMPMLLNVLSSSDQKVVEKGSICVARIVESFKSDADKLEELVSPDLLRAILRLLLPGSSNLIGPNIHTQFLQTLSITAHASPSLSTELFKMDILDTLYQILTGVSPPEDTEDVASKIDGVIIMQALIHRPKDQIFETLTVIYELLPGCEYDGSMPSTPEQKPGHQSTTRSESRHANIAARLELLEDCQDKVRRFAAILLPTLVHAYASTVNHHVRQKVLAAQLRMLSNFDVPILYDALRTVQFSSYLASILSQQDSSALVVHALQAADLLLTRMEEVYSYQFYREGVFAEVSKIASQPINYPSQDITQDPSVSTSSEANVIKSGTDTSDEGNVHDDNSDSEDNDEDDTGIIEEVTPVEDDDHEGNDDDDDDDEEDENEQDEPDADEDLSSSTSSSPTRMPTMDECKILIAKALSEKFQDNRSLEVRTKAETVLNDVKTLSSKINEVYIEGDGHGGQGFFKALSAHFSADALSSITSAELMSSGLLDVLTNVFDAVKEPSTNNARADFLDAFMGAGANPQPKTDDATSSPFSVLVHKLQDLLSRAEHFEVLTVHSNASDNNRSSATSVLSRQLKLRLTADEDSEIPKAFRGIAVSIHAIATFKALDDYLRPRISLSDRPRSGRPNDDSISGTLAAFAAATGGMPSAHHQRLLDRALLGMGDPSPIPAPPPPAPGSSSRTKKHGSGRSAKENLGVPEMPQQPAVPIEKSTTSRKSTRQLVGDNKQALPGKQDSSGSQDTLECADERQLSDEDDIDEGALDAFVDDLEEEMEDSPAQEPSAVNMEIASTGKVTARKEDGTRIPTPSHGNTPHPPPPSRARGTPQTPSASARAMSYAAAIQSTPTDWHIEFSIDGQVIPNDTTIYRAVHYHWTKSGDVAIRAIWDALHIIKFKRVQGPPPSAGSSPLSWPREQGSDPNSALPASLHHHPETSKILSLLNTLHALNSNVDEVMDDNIAGNSNIVAEPLAQFVNTKLTAKMNRQLEEPLVVASNCLPAWSEDLARLYPFLFPFETRHLFLQSTSFGYSRSMTRWQNSQLTEEPNRHGAERSFMGRLQRQKVRISRTRILESAVKVMELYGSSSSVLEVEYFEEVGTGLGPTLEFYSTVSKEFSKKKSKMWRENESSGKGEYAFGKAGLFPAPLSSEQVRSDNGKKILHLFKMLGKFVARSMLDSRIIDISFNPVFFKEKRYESSEMPSLGALKSVDATMASSLKMIKQYAQLKKQLDDDHSLTPSQKAEAAQDIRIHDARLEDLGLDFTLPGYSSIELIENGSNTPVTIDNVNSYLDKVLELTLGSGVQHQIDAFRAGFSQVFPYSATKAFTPSELVMLFGRVEEDWSIETLMDTIKADHGFNMDSRSVGNLLQTMSEFTPSQRRDFLQFVTGSPKLPIGGFKNLTPMFTVVCRPYEQPYTADDYLPSVMTCVNYLKLPDYSSLETLRTRLLTAIKEGQGAFHLS